MVATYRTEGISSADSLIAGNAHLLVGRKVTIPAGQNLPRGAVLGKITASSKFVLSAAAANDGSQIPDVILAEACDASTAEKQAIAYPRGDFAEQALTFGAGHTADSVREILRAKGITLISIIS